MRLDSHHPIQGLSRFAMAVRPPLTSALAHLRRFRQRTNPVRLVRFSDRASEIADTSLCDPGYAKGERIKIDGILFQRAGMISPIVLLLASITSWSRPTFLKVSVWYNGPGPQRSTPI